MNRLGPPGAVRRPPSSFSPIALAVLLATLASGCGGISSPPATSSGRNGPATAPLPSGAAGDPSLDLDTELAAAVARWEADRPASCGYTVESEVSGLSHTTDRVIVLEGHAERVAVQTSSFSGWQDEQLTVPGMFDLIRTIHGRRGTIQATYDPVHGYPTSIVREDRTASDGSWTMSVLDFRSSLDVPPNAGDLVAQLKEARAAWARWALTDYAYEWLQVPGASAPTGIDPSVPAAAWSIRETDGVTTATPISGDTGAVGQDQTSIEATFDAIEAAVSRGAWVDAVFDRVLGVPILVGIDPTPAVGDGASWRITFRDVVADQGQADLASAHDRWSVNRPDRYSYVWRMVNGDRRWSYRVAMDGDVADIRASGGAPVGEAATLAPRIDDLFMLLEQVVADGGHIDATYDERLGYPSRVTIDAPGLDGDTITISDVMIDVSR